MGVLDMTTSVNLNNSSLSLPHQTSDESRKSANKARLKSCIIKLTELSNSEHEKWLTSESGSTQTYISVESVEHSTSSGSRYNMRSRPTPVSARPTRRKQTIVNYTEQGMKDSGHDSDFEPVLKPQPPLDNKSYPTPTQITIQREIILNKANKRSAISTLPDATEPVQKSSKITVDSKSNAPPAQKTENNPPLPDGTKTQPVTLSPDVTNDLLPDATVDSNAVPNAINMTTSPATDDVKPSRGIFKTKRISIRRSKDQGTFKCSACDTHTSTLKELNAHFITTIEKLFVISVRHHYTHVEEDYQFKC